MPWNHSKNRFDGARVTYRDRCLYIACTMKDEQQVGELIEVLKTLKPILKETRETSQ